MNDCDSIPMVQGTCVACGTGVALPLPHGQALAQAPCSDCAAPVYASRYRRIDIGLSEVCNLKCNMCRRPQEKAFMTFERIGHILDDARRIGVETISFSGGEPFVHPRFLDILDRALSHGFAIELVTNGTLLKPEHVAVLERLKCVTLSIDGPPAVHDAIRGVPGCYDKTLRAVEMLSRSKVQWGTNTVIQAQNAAHLEETWRRIRAAGRPSYLGFTHVEVVPETAALLPPPESAGDIRRQMERVRDACHSEGIHFNDEALVTELSDLFQNKHRRFRPAGGCAIPATFLGISNYGIFPCWHQGRVLSGDGLIEPLLSDLCADILSEARDRRCVGCNAANYSWSADWVAGIRAAAEAAEWRDGVVYLSQAERDSGQLAAGTHAIPLLERQKD
ncbi:hypothetical protein CKO11_00830 [Rhodobacter sp. TJ_12]|uniref:radical SAM protein n=1 Tax=Rhodobacter sp. TJ_12 TaxID=2029399 RepID=UPI001CBDDB20|nr:radical SAM protein [Rhodobacter sp. TJ_12]MBZ4021005.1 hypothetical protein [Rhodobacter sp. TJ_12]